MVKTLLNNKKKILISLIIVIVIGAVIFELKDNSQAQEKTEEKKIAQVAVQKAVDSKSVSSVIVYPATVVGDQEVKITAQSAGTATAVNFDLGDYVSVGKILVKIDDQGNHLSSGKSGFESGQVQQLELALRQAKESLELAEKNYEKDDSAANHTARDIAKRQYESARVALNSVLESRTVTSPIAGTVTSRGVSTGDSITLGQNLATISKTNKMKIQFYVDKEELSGITDGTIVTLEDGDRKISARVSNISPQADANTKRFLIEAVPDTQESLTAGSVISVSVDIKKTSNENDSVILPLSSVNITQNENFIFILREETAKKVPVEILKVTGETVEVKANITPDALIIVDGNKLIADGEKVEVK